MSEYEQKIRKERIDEITPIYKLAKSYIPEDLAPDVFYTALLNTMLLIKLVDISKDLHKMEGCFDLLTTKEREWYS